MRAASYRDTDSSGRHRGTVGRLEQVQGGFDSAWVPLESVGVWPSSAAGRSGDLAEYGYSRRRWGMEDGMAFGPEPVPYGSGMANTSQQPAPDVATTPLRGRPHGNRSGASYRLPLGQPGVAVWCPLPLKLRIRSYQHPLPLSKSRYNATTLSDIWCLTSVRRCFQMVDTCNW